MIKNGDFENGLNGWRVVSGKAFVRQPVLASAISARHVQIDGKPLVTLGGDYWHTAYPLGQNGAHLIRVVSKTAGILDSRVFRVSHRYLVYRLGGSAGGGVAIELRVPVKTAQTTKRRPLDKPDGEGYVAVAIAQPTGSDHLREASWDLQGKKAGQSLVGSRAKVRLRVTVRPGQPQRLLVDHLRLLAKRPPPFRPSLWGWADIHCHPMAQAGFGNLLAGHMHGPVEDLGSCLTIHGHAHSNILRPVAMVLEGGRPNDGGLAATGWTTGTPGPDDQLGFRGWPAFDEILHIKTHQDWIRRAYDGGQRLMVALIVHNELLAGLTTFSVFGGWNPQSDRDTVEPQVRMLREFVAHNRAWCGLARTPAEARDLIESNKLAFVLGIETDSINGWVRFTDFPEGDAPGDREAIHSAIHDYFEYLRKLGVVQINLIHLTDNAFGGMAVYDVMFMVSSWQRTGRLPDTEDAYTGRSVEEAISRPVTLESKLWSMVQPIMNAVGIVPPPPSPVRQAPVGDRNTKGLTVAGEVALLEAMRLGMVIDTDHMSEKSEATAYDFATKTVPGKPYPLVAAHNGARALAPRPPSHADPGYVRLNPHAWPSEGQKSETQIRHIRETGGMFGHGIAGSDSAPFGGVPNDCPGSSKTVAQGLEYIASRLRGSPEQPEVPVALGTDWNALLPGPGPRFGPRAANGLEAELKHAAPSDLRAMRDGDLAAQSDGVHYDTSIRYCSEYRFKVSALDAGTPDDRRDPSVLRTIPFLWQAMALIDSGLDLRSKEVEDALKAPGANEAPGLEVARGIRGVPGTSGSLYHRTGELIDHPAATFPNEHPLVQALVPVLREIRDRWRLMTPPTGSALRRSTAGRRDFDYNIDGLCHYGMLPDMLQDLKNVGLKGSVLDGFFRSAERYIEVWERSVQAASKIPHPPPGGGP